ncbi:acyl-coenzyme A synthetase ACSM3, mitochondrial-like [Diadema setosum]|uniref:acyl-coenzyme A synthetase ACSM3, mitochondrial-like n=1 Tax=Diadema setosum TaxID=31175 RepID=UPI003B3A30B2
MIRHLIMLPRQLSSLNEMLSCWKHAGRLPRACHWTRSSSLIGGMRAAGFTTTTKGDHLLHSPSQNGSVIRNTSSLLGAKNRPYVTNISLCRSSSQCTLKDGGKVAWLPWQQPSRGFLSAVSVTGFNDYELGRQRFQLDVPEYFNFANVMDEWARREERGVRPSNPPAFWWIDAEGNELRWTFRDLELKSKKVANLLVNDCGVKPKDLVMVILPRIPEWWLFNIACLRIGAVLTPGSMQLRTRDIKDRLERSQSVCIVTSEEMAPSVDQAGEFESLKCKLLVNEKGNEQRPGWIDYRSLYERSSDQHECVQTRSDDPMTVFFTSGTTGSPKMAEHTHASYGLGHMITGKYWLDMSSTDIIWNMSDTGWAKSAYSNVFGPWYQGGCVFIDHSPKFDPLRTLQVMSDYPISVLCAPPTAYRLMIQQDMSKFNLRSLRHVLSAGEPLNPEVMEVWRKRTGGIIREGYGQTETVVVCGAFRCIQPKPGSCGKAAPGYDLAIVDEEGNELPHGEEGIIGIRVKPKRPVSLFTRYVGDPERTASVFKGDFYLTGDKARMDEEGYIWFVGRNDDIISSAGYRIGPFEVESALVEHPAVIESAAVSSPDPIRGEIVKAFVVLAESHKDRPEEELTRELQDHVKTITAPYKYPRKIEFVDSLPKTVSGKIRRVELRQREWAALST